MEENYEKNWLIFALLVIFMALVFYKNLFVSDPQERIESAQFQQDSENLVLGGIIKDKYKINGNGYGLQHVKIFNNSIKKDNLTYVDILENNYEGVTLIPYTSQFGLHGMIFSFLYNKLGINLNVLHFLCCFILSFVIVNICRLLQEKYGNLFSIIFFIGFLLSPWITNFAKNLYWVEFTWFLPLMFCLLLSKTKNMKLYLPCIYLSILFKCLCGYEYISAIMLFSISFLLVDFFEKKDERKQNLKTILIVGIISILGFATAITVHGSVRGGGNILEGIGNIVTGDVIRRTTTFNGQSFYDDSVSNNLDQKLVNESLKASVLEVVKKYFNFNTDILIGIDGRLFNLICILSAVILINDIIKKKKYAIRDLVMWIVLLLCPLSWFVLAKGHSYIHTHMNFVLWYFGYIQVAIYIIVKFFLEKIKEYKGENKK